MRVPQCLFCVSILPTYCIKYNSFAYLLCNYTHLYIQYMWHRLLPESGLLHCFNSRLMSHNTLYCTTVVLPQNHRTTAIFCRNVIVATGLRPSIRCMILNSFDVLYYCLPCIVLYGCHVIVLFYLVLPWNWAFLHFDHPLAVDHSLHRW